MSKRLSGLYGLGVYTEKAEYIGKVEEVILNIEKGEILWLSLESFKNRPLPNEDIKRILQQGSVPYTEVVQAGDIVICKRNPKTTGRKQKTRDERE